MGKGNKAKATTDYNTALIQAQKPSAQEEALGKAALQTLNWASAGDFRDPRGGGIFVNYADPAIARRNREILTNAGGQGIFALGTPGPNYLASVRSNRLAEDEMSDAAQYEKDIQEGIMRAAGYAGDTARMDQARRQSVLGTTAGIYQNQMNQPKWWQYLFGGMQQAGQAAAMVAA